ncbi:hypothetical protein [Prosthecobacter sp.]|uniref:hypothetical protein n=1 Tax=Prosthecobacter sp. TaxID=1965333 RepID=UPI002AB9E36E|nr:hypothetical protein [Prosthecobacter sp.]MDZ4401137.1 hypothetical protein [Prosthecobacter sp.]
MKTTLQRLVFAGLLLSLGVSCTTAYDAHGRPRQVVEPSTAILGAAAVGLIAYGIANNHNRRRYDNRYYGHYGRYR